jgi:hypothetical protein
MRARFVGVVLFLVGASAGRDGGTAANDVVAAASSMQAQQKFVILHDAHEGSHATCEALAHLCVRTDCSENHDALYHNKTIDWPTIEASHAQVFLTRFFPMDMPLDHWKNYSVLMLARKDLFSWAMGLYHFSDPKQQLGKSGDAVNFSTSTLIKSVQSRVRSYHCAPPVDMRLLLCVSGVLAAPRMHGWLTVFTRLREADAWPRSRLSLQFVVAAACVRARQMLCVCVCMCACVGVGGGDRAVQSPNPAARVEIQGGGPETTGWRRNDGAHLLLRDVLGGRPRLPAPRVRSRWHDEGD